MKVPPVPTPTPGMSGLGVWANNIVSYLRTLSRFIEQPGPKAVQLEFRRVDAKATENGVLMFDNTIKKPIVSVDGEWYSLELGIAPLAVSGLKDNK